MISQTTVDATLDRLLRHMAWANAALIGQLAGLTDEALGLSAPRNEWTVAMILQHQVDAADRYASRLEGRAAPRGDRASHHGRRAHRGRRSLRRHRREDPRPGGRPGRAVALAGPGKPGRPRSTILAQAIHHATEHRAQIAGALSTHGIDAIDLDALDVWAYGDAEGLGA